MEWICFLVFLFALSSGEDADTTTEQTTEAVSNTDEIPYVTPQPAGNFYLAEHFDDRADFNKRWVFSESKKEDESKYSGKWDVEEAERSGLSGDLGLVLKSRAQHHAIATRLDKPFLFDNKLFILQYEVRFQKGQECGGAYIKLLSQVGDLDLRNFHDKTPYTIMFGPDKCGNDNKLHFIFRHRNPKNGSFEEKHWTKAKVVPKLDDVFKDKKPHLFTLILHPDNKFELLLDQISVHKGSLLDDFSPPVNPPAEIDDPTDTKPLDWDEREKIPDPSATKPDDWDEDAPRQIVDPNARKPEGWLDEEPELIPDPSAKKPSDWDDDMDGEWEPPLINNPKCEKVGCGKWKAPMVDNPSFKGKWRPPLIDNPNYKGKWKPRRIANPYYFEDRYPYKMTPIAAVGFELWSMSEDIMFDNIVITDDRYVADQWAAETFSLKRELADRETDNMLMRLFKYTNKHPWLWAVYVVVIGLPVVLFIGFCCTTDPRASAAAAKEKDAKKRALAKKPPFPKPPQDKVGVKETKEQTIKEVQEEEEEEEGVAETEKLSGADNQGEDESAVLEEEEGAEGEEGEEPIVEEAGVTEEEIVDKHAKVEEIDEKIQEEGDEPDVDASGDFPRRRRPRKE